MYNDTTFFKRFNELTKALDLAQEHRSILLNFLHQNIIKHVAQKAVAEKDIEHIPGLVSMLSIGVKDMLLSEVKANIEVSEEFSEPMRCKILRTHIYRLK